MPVVCLNNVSKSFGSQKVIDNLCLDIVKGEFLTLLGPSGCGKTTVLRLIAGLETCDSGAILINGRDQTRLPACDRDVNTVFQSYALFPHMNVFDNIAFGLKLKKIPGRRIRDRVRESLALVKLEGMDNRPIHQLSGGQQQRVAIARSLAMKPKVMLFDEPTSALDPELVGEVVEVMERLAKEGMTIIAVTHELHFARDVADRILIMDNGNWVEQGPPEKIFNNPEQERTRQFLAHIL